MITTFPRLKTVRGLDAGPLSTFIEDYIAVLRGQGYRAGAVRGHLCLFARLNRWLVERGLGLVELDEGVLDRSATRRLCRRNSIGGGVSPLLRLLDMLRRFGVTPPPIEIALSPAQGLAQSYRRFLREERGCADWTISNYTRHIDSFLDAQSGRRKLDFSRLQAREVSAFVQRNAREHSQAQTKQVVTALRSFLSYLHYRGLAERSRAGGAECGALADDGSAEASAERHGAKGDRGVRPNLRPGPAQLRDPAVAGLARVESRRDHRAPARRH